MTEIIRDEKTVYEDLYYSGASGIYHRTQHRLLESHAAPRYELGLEVGAGSGEHARFLRSEFGLYVAQDILAPQDGTMPNFVQSDVRSLPFPGGTFNRIVLGCVLHHVANPLRAIREIRRVAATGCHLSVLLPCDPGMMYRAVRHVTVHRRLRRAMQDADVMARWAELHPNNVLGILSLLQSEFRRDHIRIRRRPFPLLSWNLNLFIIIDAWVRRQPEHS